jgi:hypothetical protein
MALMKEPPAAVVGKLWAEVGRSNGRRYLA